MFVNGNRFEGEWKNDMLNGNIKEITKDGHIYEANWKDEMRDGK
jgi:hypothetical protein